MIISVNNKTYKMSRSAAEGVLKVASEQVPIGIYAVESKGRIELLNIPCSSKMELKNKKELYIKRGFKVYANG